MQSNLAKQRNLEEAEAKIGSKIDTAPDSITKEDAATLHSRQTRALGQQPPSDSIAAQAQHQAAVNEGATAGHSEPALEPEVQSQKDRQANYEEAADTVGKKLVNEPENVIKEEADLLHSREQRAFGTTEKGGLASQAQHQVAENEKP